MASSDEKKRYRASIACSGCRARRTKCITLEGQTSCDRCIRLQKPCIVKNDDQRKRPVTKARADMLASRIETLESMLILGGEEVPLDNTKPAVHASTSENSPPAMSSAPRQKLRSVSTDGFHPGSFTKIKAPTISTSDSPQSHTSSERDKVVDSTLRSGYLKFDHPGGRSRYFGASTNYHIYSHSNSSEMSSKFEAQNEKTRQLIQDIPQETHNHLMDRFWKCHNSVIHVLHRAAFEFGKENRDSTYYSTFLHICILAIGYRYAERTKFGVQRFAIPDRESVLHKEAKRLVEHELEMPGGIPSLEALILLGDLECGIGKYNTGWLYAGMGSRLTFDLGLHRDCDHLGLSVLEISARKTALWACVTIDRYWALFLGRPTSIKISDLSTSKSVSRHIDTSYPSEFENTSEVEIYNALIDLMEVSAKLAEDVHIQARPADPSAYFFVATLDRELQTWYKSLPHKLKWIPQNIENAPPSLFILHQQYHSTLILLHRPFTSPPLIEGERSNTIDGVTQVSRSTCFDNAIKVAEIFGVFCQRFDIKTMFVTGMQHAATSAIAIVEGMTIDNSKNRAEHILHLQCLAEALHAHSLSYFPAKRMSNILFNVIGEYRRNQVCSGQQTPQNQIEGSVGTTTNNLQPEVTALIPAYENTGQNGHGSKEMNFFLDDVDISYLATRMNNQSWGGPGDGRENPEFDVSNHTFSSDDEIWANIMQTLSQPLEF